MADFPVCWTWLIVWRITLLTLLRSWEDYPEDHLQLCTYTMKMTRLATNERFGRGNTGSYVNFNLSRKTINNYRKTSLHNMSSHLWIILIDSLAHSSKHLNKNMDYIFRLSRDAWPHNWIDLRCCRTNTTESNKRNASNQPLELYFVISYQS